MVHLGLEAEPGNAAPTADAGADRSVGPGARVTLDGSGSTDPEGAIQAYRWEQTAGTSVTLAAAASARTAFTAPTVATGSQMLTFRLTVTDQGQLQDTDTCSIEVTSQTDGVTTPSESSGGGGCFLKTTGFF